MGAIASLGREGMPQPVINVIVRHRACEQHRVMSFAALLITSLAVLTPRAFGHILVLSR
jgi:hypothetical protein